MSAVLVVMEFPAIFMALYLVTHNKINKGTNLQTIKTAFLEIPNIILISSLFVGYFVNKTVISNIDIFLVTIFDYILYIFLFVPSFQWLRRAVKWRQPPPWLRSCAGHCYWQAAGARRRRRRRCPEGAAAKRAARTAAAARPRYVPGAPRCSPGLPVGWRRHPPCALPRREACRESWSRTRPRDRRASPGRARRPDTRRIRAKQREAAALQTRGGGNGNRG